MRSPGSAPWTLRLEIEGHDHSNRVRINGQTIEVGRAIPDCQVPGNAWDELMFRRLRLDRIEP